MSIRLKSFINRGRPQNHANYSCGFPSSSTLPFTGGVEINFEEGAGMRGHRRGAGMAAVYSVKQVVSTELLIQLLPSGWNEISFERSIPDDPDLALVVFNPANGLISTADTPGFIAEPSSMVIPPRRRAAANATSVFLQQNFKTWIEYGGAGVSQEVFWHNFLLVQRSAPGSLWVINRVHSSIGLRNIRHNWSPRI